MILVLAGYRKPLELFPHPQSLQGAELSVPGVKQLLGIVQIISEPSKLFTMRSRWKCTQLIAFNRIRTPAEQCGQTFLRQIMHGSGTDDIVFAHQAPSASVFSEGELHVALVEGNIEQVGPAYVADQDLSPYRDSFASHGIRFIPQHDVAISFRTTRVTVGAHSSIPPYPSLSISAWQRHRTSGFMEGQTHATSTRIQLQLDIWRNAADVFDELPNVA